MYYRKVSNYCKENNLSIKSFEEKCGLANGTVGGWKNGGKPSVATLIKISSATGIPIEKWLADSE